MKHSISAILFDENEIQTRISDLASQISKDYESKNLVIICILKGSFVFLADMIRWFTIPVKIDFMAISSYGNRTESSGEVTIKKDIDIDIKGKDVLILDDIVDTGISMTFLFDHLKKYRPNSIRSCALLVKQKPRLREIKIDYKGFEIEDDFVIGYGLDYAEKFRNLPYIGILKEEIYRNE